MPQWIAARRIGRGSAPIGTLFDASKQYGGIVGLTIVLLLALNGSHRLQHHAPDVWMLCMVAVTAGMALTRSGATFLPGVRLWRSIGLLSGLYALAHYPLMPVLPGFWPAATYTLMLALWVSSLICAIGCFWIQALAVLPPAFLVWSTAAAGSVTGLTHGSTLDIAPLAEVSACLTLGFGVSNLSKWLVARYTSNIWIKTGFGTVCFQPLILWIAIGIHLSNYFWSAVAKFKLPGPLFAWIRFNNPLYIFLVAMDDHHIPYSGQAEIVRFVAGLIDKTHVFSNFLIFGVQAVALFGLLMPRKALLLLLVAVDLMHIAIAVIAGANFWPWIVLNVAIAIVVADADYRQPKRVIGLCLAGFIVMAPRVANIASLGWFDSGANNRIFVQAEAADGSRYYVSPNFFTFYSYPIGHMDYGTPVHETAFDVGNPNGGTWTYAMMRAGLSCDVAKLVAPNGHGSDPDRNFWRFLVNYHAMARMVERRLGSFPFDLYPHHFYVDPSLMADYDRLDKSTIVAYIYRRESVCLSLVDGEPRRRLISSGEVRIEVPRDAIAK